MVVRLGREVARARPRIATARRSRRTPVLMVLPAAVVLAAITLFPLLFTLRLTVLSWELTTGFPPRFIGLQNFVRVLAQDPRFWNAMANTGVLVAVGVGLQTAIGIGLALELNRLRRGRTLVLSLLLIPVMIAPVIAGFQFRMILNDQYGPLNYLLDALTFGRVHGYAWLADPGVALWAVMAADVWQWTPFMTLVVLAGLRSLPGELLEAAEVDGATGPQALRRVTLPLLLWMFLTSFKSNPEFCAYPPVFIPKSFALTNYLNAMRMPPGGRGGLQGVRDSLIVSAGSMLISVLAGAPAAYSFARFRTGGENLSFWVLSTRMFPPVASALPLFLVFKALHLLDTHWALIVANTIFNLPFVIWLLKGFFEDLPAELEEAAVIDGTTIFGAFRRVALPLVAPGLAATALFSFIFAWNEFMFALLFTRSDVRTLTIIVPSLVGGHEILWGQVAAVGVVAIIPNILLALLLQRYLVRGLTLGAVKG